jgi:hypothetical protein
MPSSSTILMGFPWMFDGSAMGCAVAVFRNSFHTKQGGPRFAVARGHVSARIHQVTVKLPQKNQKEVY